MSHLVRCVRDPVCVAPARAGVVTVLSCVTPPPFFAGPTVARDMDRVLGELAPHASVAGRDLISVAMGATAADTFVLRDRAADGWCRIIRLIVPVEDVAACETVRLNLEEALHFLSGDMWTLDFTPAAPTSAALGDNGPDLGAVTCVSLLSGGLDSAIAAFDLLAVGERPLFVSHAYPKDAARQEAVLAGLPLGWQRVRFNADPRGTDLVHDISMRTRSFNFLAVAAAAADAVATARRSRPVRLVVPENGFIALNAPLTLRRLGSHSTRTTHPHFLSLMQVVLDGLGLSARIENPYRHATKGEMILTCKDRARLLATATATISCGKWKRKNMHCGRCVPCLIRRAAFLKGRITDATPYKDPLLSSAVADPRTRDDILAMCIAAARPVIEMESWARRSGPLPADPVEYGKWVDVAERGMREVEALLRSQGVFP